MGILIEGGKVPNNLKGILPEKLFWK